MDSLVKVPVLFNKKTECCGCLACFAICLQEAIYIEEDKEGFLYPHIDEHKCIGCRRCLKVCPYK